MSMRARSSVMITTLVACLGLIVASGCEKKKDAPGGGAAGKAAAGSMQRALGVLPKDVDVVLGVNLPSIRASGLFKKYEPEMMKAAGDELAEVKAKCGFDPVQKLNMVVVAGRGEEEAQDLTIVAEGISKAELGPCLEKYAAEKGGTFKTDGNVMEGVGKDGKKITLLWIDDKTVLMSGRGEVMAERAALETLASGKDTLTSSAAFMDVINAVNTSASLWFVSNGKSAVAAKVPVKFAAAFGAIQIKDGIDVDVAIRMLTDAEATQMADMAKSQIGQLKSSPFGSMIGEIKIEAKGKDVKVQTAVTQAQIDQLVNFAKAML